MYLLCGIRPNIVFAIRQFSNYSLVPKMYYIKVAKKIIHYLKDTIPRINL